MTEVGGISLLKYIGRPYETYNCFDLVKEFYKDFYGIDLRHYYEGNDIPPRDQVKTLIVSNQGDFEETKVPEFGDIVVIRLYGIECHVGVCINRSQFLHSARKLGSNVERLERYQKLIAGYFRHRARINGASK